MSAQETQTPPTLGFPTPHLRQRGPPDRVGALAPLGDRVAVRVSGRLTRRRTLGAVQDWTVIGAPSLASEAMCEAVADPRC